MGNHHEPRNAQVILVTPDEAERTQAIFELLLGENLSGRKEHIAEEGHKYLDMIDSAKRWMYGKEKNNNEKRISR